MCARPSASAGPRSCATRCWRASWNCATSRRSRCATARSMAPRRCCTGAIRAWAQAAEWRAGTATPPRKPHTFRLALNLATPQLHADVARRLLAELRKHRLPPGSIELELNEQLLFDANADIAAMLLQLQQAGAGITLDDFGSAHSSLAACKRLRLDALKIDRHFIAAIGNGDGGDDIVAAIIHLARAMSMQVVALGVTGMAQLDVLRALGCDRYQGELFCAPQPASELLQHLYHTVGATTQTAAAIPHSILTNEDFVDE